MSLMTIMVFQYCKAYPAILVFELRLVEHFPE